MYLPSSYQEVMDRAKVPCFLKQPILLLFFFTNNPFHLDAHLSTKIKDQSLLPFHTNFCYSPLPCIHAQKTTTNRTMQKQNLNKNCGQIFPLFLINIHHVTKFPEQITSELSISNCPKILHKMLQTYIEMKMCFYIVYSQIFLYQIHICSSLEGSLALQQRTVGYLC